MQGQARLRAGLVEVRRRLDEVEASATNYEGTISATVGGRGQVLELTLHPRVFRQTNARALSDEILETVRAAAKNAADEAFRLTTKALGQERA